MICIHVNEYAFLRHGKLYKNNFQGRLIKVWERYNKTDDVMFTKIYAKWFEYEIETGQICDIVQYHFL